MQIVIIFADTNKSYSLKMIFPVNAFRNYRKINIIQKNNGKEE